MTEWKRYKLKDISVLSNGINFNKSAYTSGVKLIGVADFKDRLYPDYNSLQEVDSKVVRSGDYLEKGDIVFVRSNGNKELVGRCMMIDMDVPVTYSGFCIKLHLIDTKLFDPVYFNYLFRTRQFKKSMTGTAVGANIQNLSQSRLGNCEVFVPNNELQKKVASTLSHYDSLIDNYQHRICLLEEAAQRLFKEWFVDFRFPDNQNFKIVNGIPEGWKKGMLTEVFDFKYGKILPTKSFVTNGPIPVYGASKIIGYYTEANCFEPKVLVGSRGNAGYVHRTIENETYVTNNSFIITPIEQYDHIKLPYIFESFKAMDFVAICTGAAQPQLTLNSIASLKYTIPPKDLIIKFDDIATNYFKDIALAYRQINLLTEARDRLLPKLMSGEIKC